MIVGPWQPVTPVERSVDFNYGYRMKCECGGVSYISPQDYFAEADEAHMRCELCGQSFNYGRGVAAIRDINDIALDNERLNALAWYHTSTDALWPAESYAAARQPELEAATTHMVVLSPDQLAAWRTEEVNKALHVGTYEAAIENMLRRIDDQHADPTAFYLHRVGLRADPKRVNGGFRDENEEPASQLTTMDLDADGLNVVRYLNTYEAIGSLSLAVVPVAIAWVQTLKLPAADLAPTHPEPLARLLDDVQEQLDALRSVKPDTSAIPPRQLRMMELAGEPGPDGIVAASRAHAHQAGELRAAVEQALRDAYLGGLAPRIACDFEQAVGWPAGASAHEFAAFFAASAVALTAPDAVIALVARQERRAVSLPPRDSQRASGSRDW